jgi:hypothetical protein
VLQWNFFLTDVISVFAEPGLAIVHDWWKGWWPGRCPGGVCEYRYSHTSLAPAIWGGARFLFSKSVGATIRVGMPSLTVGLSILL